MKTLKYAVRFLVRSHSYSLINLFGLAFSLACSIILLRYIHRELTVDTHCVDRERVVIPLRYLNKNLSMASTEFSDTTFIPNEKIIRRSKFNFSQDEYINYNENNYRVNVINTDTVFMKLFHYPLVEGSTDLSVPGHAIITRDMAQRLFGKESAIGKVIEHDKASITIYGVIDKPSCKTLFNFDILISKQFTERAEMELIEVLPSVDLEAVNKISNVLRRFKLQNGNYSPLLHSFEFVPIKDMYFRYGNHVKDYQERFFTFGSSDYLNILFIVAVLLLFVGVMNFINLYMVYMMKRKKEYGIKKVYGLQRGPLFLQIWLENFLLAFWALMVSWLIIEITQVPVSQLMGVKMGYTPFDLYLSLGFLLLLPLLTSVYPYLRHQYIAPITSMRAIANSRQSVATRMMLLSVQYVVTFVLMVFSLYLNKHFQFLINTSPGFRTERILEASLVESTANLNDFEASLGRIDKVNQKLQECPDIETWSQSGSIIKGTSFTKTYYDDKDQAFELNSPIQFTSSFMKIYDLKIVEGELPDSTDFRTPVIVINRAAMKLMGYKHIEEAFIRPNEPIFRFYTPEGVTEYGKSLQPVAAVIEDYYSGHITEGVKPMIAVYQVDKVNNISTGKHYLVVREGKEQAVIDYLKKIVREVYNTEELEYSWISDQVKAIYDEDRRVATIYTLFALIAIGVSCLGLFGISLFDIRQRYREIGIRKVNGAGMKDLYKLLFRKYVLILVASFAVAIPLAWYAIHIYTADFVVKAPVSIDVFLIALLVIALISLGTLYWQIRKAANINPSIVMKRE